MTRSFSFLVELEHASRGARSTPMGAPQPIKGLADTLRGQLASAVERANRIGDKAKSSVGNLHAVLDTAEDTIRDVDAAAADIQSALGLSTNGGPPLDAASQAASRETSSDSAPRSSGRVEVTPIGHVYRPDGS
jgi:ABC-type transporter Mla subunit MlaD